MIIYGSKMYGVRNVIYAHGVCNHCGNLVKHKSYDGRKWGHLYFIPLIPSGGHLRVLQECPSCKMGQHLPIAEVDKLYRTVEELLQICLAAAATGKHTFTDPKNREEVASAPFLADAMVVLYTTGHGEDIPGILSLLESDGALYEFGAAGSAYEELLGHASQAEAAIDVAKEAEPGEAYPLLILAEYARRKGAHEKQIALLTQANELVGGEDVSIMLEMVDCYEAMGQMGEAVAIMDRSIALVPELEQNKKFMKLRKKYGKRAAKQGA